MFVVENTHSMRKWAIQHIWCCMGDLKQLFFFIFSLFKYYRCCCCCCWSIFFYFFVTLSTRIVFQKQKVSLFRCARTPTIHSLNNSIVKFIAISLVQPFGFFIGREVIYIYIQKKKQTIAFFTLIHTQNFIQQWLDCTNQTIRLERIEM